MKKIIVVSIILIILVIIVLLNINIEDKENQEKKEQVMKFCENIKIGSNFKNNYNLNNTKISQEDTAFIYMEQTFMGISTCSGELKNGNVVNKKFRYTKV